MLIQEKTKLESVHEEVKFLHTLKVENTQDGLAYALKAICEFARWDYGEAWVPSEEGTVLEISPVWYVNTSIDSATANTLELFRFCSEGFVMPPNVGLPGRVWLSQQAEWIPNLSTQSEGYFLRNKIAKACGVKTGLGIPLFINNEFKAVITFFKTL